MRSPDYLPLCSIAGWDPTCGAGAGADLRVFSAHGAHGAAVLTALTAQTEEGVNRFEAVEVDMLREQLRSVAEAGEPPRAWKLGLIANTETAAQLGSFCRAQQAPVVWDPVLAPTAGGWSLPDDALDPMRRLLGQVTLVTPNADEARRLAGVGEETDARDAARMLLSLGAPAVLLTGGDGGAAACDWLLRENEVDKPFELARVAGGPFHGTGCALSSALAVRLAQGHELEDAVLHAKRYVHALLALAAQTKAWLLPHMAVRPS